ncbi:sigma-E factor negative regulatory protein [Thiorhodococcus mannitoliphagus]|uniref:Sigma-E factor negative regulatory protein n=1 Tax=Thiorhodococcus mannitoliphagus TaxID=329406 RepID=A0A6P1DSE9_9GAMM|nr:sigma-E factor negative regulatory protein [Thiorhodococcus mannitoliphagus]NEX20103.1 sigma-E factor negative regulatory protein [Thiorhodococcus mannitoliphagus]
MMTDEHRQRLSELLDGELGARSALRVLDAVNGGGELRGAWERYSLIGQAIRAEAIAPEYRGVADGVWARLEREPIPLAASRSGTRHRSRGRKTAALAMAASVAFLAFFAAPTLFRDAGTIPDEGAAAPRLVERESVPISRLQLERPALANKLDL